MRELTLRIPDEALAAVAESPEEAGAELRMLAAVKLFELKKLSSGAAARPAFRGLNFFRGSAPTASLLFSRPRKNCWTK
jgi:uncharacterized protein UPF0175